MECLIDKWSSCFIKELLKFGIVDTLVRIIFELRNLTTKSTPLIFTEIKLVLNTDVGFGFLHIWEQVGFANKKLDKYINLL